MERPSRPFGLRARVGALAALLPFAGCGGESAPSVASTNSEASVHGTVKYKGQPLTSGEIQFDPANIRRRDATQVHAPIGKDGTYTIKTLQGGNSIHVSAPADIKSKDPNVVTFMKEYDVPSGDSTFDVELSPK